VPRIPSANVANFSQLSGPGPVSDYFHPAEKRRGAIPVAFQVTSPFNRTIALLPHALVMHVNPSNMTITSNHKVEKIQTRGGWVEQHWGDELDEISCDGTTGAFMNLYTGLSSVVRQQTIAWDRFRDLYDLYHNNGSLYDPYGNIVLQGNIMLMYDRGVYCGTFRSFDIEETDETPFSFSISWTFKVEMTLLQIPSGEVPIFNAPSFQSGNATRGI
jgi:hypothetical protein